MNKKNIIKHKQLLSINNISVLFNKLLDYDANWGRKDFWPICRKQQHWLKYFVLTRIFGYTSWYLELYKYDFKYWFYQMILCVISVDVAFLTIHTTRKK